MIFIREDYNDMGLQGLAAHVGVDEPVFLVLGRDMNAAKTVEAWCDIASDAGAHDDIIAQGHHGAGIIESWQRDNPDQVKVPDLPGISERDEAMALVKVSDNVIYVAENGDQWAAIVTRLADGVVGNVYLQAFPFDGPAIQIASIPYSSKGMPGSWHWSE